MVLKPIILKTFVRKIHMNPKELRIHFKRLISHRYYVISVYDSKGNEIVLDFSDSAKRFARIFTRTIEEYEAKGVTNLRIVGRADDTFIERSPNDDTEILYWKEVQLIMEMINNHNTELGYPEIELQLQEEAV